MPPTGPVWSMWLAMAAGLLLVLGLLIFALGGESEPASRPRQAKQEKRKEPPAPDAPKIEEPAPKPIPAPSFAPSRGGASEGKPPPKPDPVPEPAPTPPPPPQPKPEPPASKPEPAAPKPEPKTTVVEVASVERVDGDLAVSRGGQKKPAQAGDPVLAGDVLESTGTSVVKYPDGTRVELRAETTAGFPASDAGKRIALERGTVRAQVAKQPPAQPMMFLTPHGGRHGPRNHAEARRRSRWEGRNPLDVEEGKVKLLRKLDGKTVDVTTGHYAIVATGAPMTSRLIRVATGLQALYTFKEGKGAVVHDTAKVGAPVDLRIENEQAVKWTAKGLAIAAPTLVGSTGPASRISQACKATNEFSLEVWFQPATVTPGAKDGRIVVFSSDIKNQNFLLGQDEFQGPVRSYFVRLRSSVTDLVGKPDLQLPQGHASMKVTHLVYSRASSGAAVIYIDGAEAGKATIGGNLSTWNDGYRLSLANESSNDRPWLGEYHLVAIYNRALTADDAKQNFKAGAE
jgi:hypothetical protein